MNNRSLIVNKLSIPRVHAIHHATLCHPPVRNIGIFGRLINGLCDNPLTRCLANILDIQQSAHTVTRHKLCATTLVTGFAYKTPILSSVALDPSITIPLHMLTSVYMDSLTTGFADCILGQECEDCTANLLNLLENPSDIDSFEPITEAAHAIHNDHSGSVESCPLLYYSVRTSGIKLRAMWDTGCTYHALISAGIVEEYPVLTSKMRTLEEPIYLSGFSTEGGNVKATNSVELTVYIGGYKFTTHFLVCPGLQVGAPCYWDCRGLESIIL